MLSVLVLFVCLSCVLSHGDHEHLESKEHILMHLKETLGELTDEMKNKMTEEEQLHFHWFRQHDYDNNKHLDGLELVHAISHFNDGPMDEAALIEVIDEILQADDKNNDGLLDYIEFSEAERHFI
ncbi:multiple coagulation factor deficiency protein 2 homolog [Bolinopsis microptera]|uniref:multiple coagulation factor deficiency protein 2 homolog n=1 Tax=Bolinopsis microptera TaxID=2820187 RepID=UPI003078FF78